MQRDRETIWALEWDALETLFKPNAAIERREATSVRLPEGPPISHNLIILTLAVIPCRSAWLRVNYTLDYTAKDRNIKSGYNRLTRRIAEGCDGGV